MESSFIMTRRRVVFRQGKQQEEDQKRECVDTTAGKVECCQNPDESPPAVSSQPSSSSSSSESSSSILTLDLYGRDSSSRSRPEQREESSLESLSKKLSLNEEKSVKSVEAIAKSFKRPQETFQWKTLYISIPSSAVSPNTLISASNQKRSRDFDENSSNTLVPGEFPHLIRRLCHEHSRIKMKKPKSSSSRERLKDIKENSCERCQMMTSWMVAIRQAVIAASTLPFDSRYHYVSYSVDKRGIIYCNEPLIRFLPIRSSEQAPRKRPRTEVNTFDDR